MKTAPYSEHRRLSTPRAPFFSRGYAQRRVRGVLHGSALITAIVFALIVAITLAGIGTLTVSHYSLARTQSDSAAALDLAEAGINYELHQITENGGKSDPPGSTFQASAAIDPSLTGAFTVTCVYSQTGAPWAGPTLKDTTVVITSAAQVNGATRTVTVNGAPKSTFYTTYSAGVKTGYTQFLGQGAVVDGICGTNGTFYIASTPKMPQITSIVFNGAGAKWTNNPGGYKTVQNNKPVTWDSVTSILNKQFPLGGASYVAANNDNALATISDPNNPNSQLPGGIVGNNLNPSGTQTVTLHGRPDGQPANYYLSNIYMTDHSNLVFDNSTGPINIYYVASAGASGGSQYLRGGHAVKALVDAPNNGVKMYISATGGLGIQPDDANDEVDMGIYAYDSKTVGTKTADFGLVDLQGNINFKGQIISKNITVEGGAHITGQQGYFDTPQEYFGFSGAWQEINSQGFVGGGNQ